MTSVSVVVAAADPGRDLTTTLRSLARQTLPRDRFEVVVADSGHDDLSGPLATLTKSDPELTVRRVRVHGASVAQTRQIGVAAARGLYVTFVDAGDTVTTGYLGALLDAAGPNQVALAELDRAVGRSTSAAVLRLARGDGRVLQPGDVPAAFERATGKLAPTSLVRTADFGAAEPGDEAGDAGGDDGSAWLRLFARTAFVFGRPARPEHARYTERLSQRRHETADFTTRVSRHLQAIEQLEQVDSVEPAVVDLVERLTHDRTRHVNRFLRLHPYQHPNAIEEIRRRGLTTIDFDVLNHGVARDLAVLYIAPPYSDTSALVVARRIRAAAIVRDVVSSDMSTQTGLDPHGSEIWREFVEREYETPTRPQSAWWPGAMDFCRKGMTKIETWQRGSGAYRSIYSRAMWPTAHLLAAWYKVRNPGSTWLAELSDPLVYNIFGEQRPSSGQVDAAFLAELEVALAARGVARPRTDNMYVWIETLVYALADRILFTNDHQRSYMLARSETAMLAARAREHSVVAPHPTLPPEFYRKYVPDYDVDPDLVNIAYFGIFYATRGLTEVIDALHALPADVRRAVRLHVFTAKPDELTAEAADAGLGETIVANAYVGYLEFLNLTTRFDALLVNDARTADTHDINPYLPSKLSDYLGSQRPIWGLVEPGSVLSSRSLDYRSELGDVAGAVAVLERIVADTTAQRGTAPTGSSS